MSIEYLLFVSVYAVLLGVASVIVLTEPGQAFILRVLEDLGARTGTGPWGFLQSFGPAPAMAALSVRQRAQIAESYIVDARKQTLVGARVALWVLIGGCVACALAAFLIVGILPILVVNGAWPYETYRRAALVVVYGTATGGVLMGAGIAYWTWRTVFRMNCGGGCAAARSILLSVKTEGVSAELAHELGTGQFPGLSRLVSHERR